MPEAKGKVGRDQSWGNSKKMLDEGENKTNAEFLQRAPIKCA